SSRQIIGAKVRLLLLPVNRNPSRAGSRPRRSRAPESPHRKDEAKHPRHAKGVERPDEKVRSGGSSNANAGAHHVKDGHGRRQERPGEENGQAPSAIAAEQRSAQVDDEYGHRNEIHEAAASESQHDVLCNVDRQQQDREQRRHDEEDVRFHAHSAMSNWKPIVARPRRSYAPTLSRRFSPIAS